MSEEAVLFETRGPVAWLTMNRPAAMNAINTDTIACFEKYLPKIVSDSNIRVVVLTGKGPAFCAGADLKAVQNSSDLAPGEPSFLDRGLAVFTQLRNLKQPLIIALNGITLAGGLELTLSGDIVLAADTAKIGDGHANYGVFPGGGGASILPRIIPRNVAAYLLFTGGMVSAQEMKSYGLVNEVHPADQLEASAQKLGEAIATKSPLALRRMKEVVRSAMDKPREDALRHEYAEMLNQMRSYDFAEGIRAFGEKRKPKFEGR
jgi:enoyl-CoA hydratase